MPQGETDLIDAVVADYEAGDMGCNASGVCSDPLTIFTYSQSSAVASLAEQQLADDKIPDDALRFVMLGANPRASSTTCTRPMCTTSSATSGRTPAP